MMARALRSDSKMALAFEAFNIGFDHSFYEAGQTGSNADNLLEEATGRLGWQMSQNWRLDASLRENLEEKKGCAPMRLLPMKMIARWSPSLRPRLFAGW